MKLTEAIKIAQIEEQSDFQGITYDYEDAIRLLIEAGQRIQVGRNNPGTHWNEPLPGETAE